MQFWHNSTFENDLNSYYYKLAFTTHTHKHCITHFILYITLMIIYKMNCQKWLKTPPMCITCFCYRFTASSGTVGKAGREVKSDLALIRLKARYRTIDILPMYLYQDLIQVGLHYKNRHESALPQRRKRLLTYTHMDKNEATFVISNRLLDLQLKRSSRMTKNSTMI